MAKTDWEKEHEVEDDLRSVIRASGVKKDPDRMKAVKALAKKKIDCYKAKEEEAQQGIALGEGKDVA